jgi:hypothetical protein
MADTAAFLALMTNFAIPRRDVLQAGRIETPVPEHLFYGCDQRNRVFINIPVTCTYRTGATITAAVVIHQIYANRDDLFAVSSAVPLLTTEGFLGDRLGDFTKLGALLGGDTLRVYERLYWDGNRYVESLSRWVEITAVESMLARVLAQPDRLLSTALAA